MPNVRFVRFLGVLAGGVIVVSLGSLQPPASLSTSNAHLVSATYSSW